MRVVRICGLGGQGVVLAGRLLGAAAVRQWKFVVQTQSYGSAARGGASRADVTVSDQPIMELAPPRYDFLIAMSQPAHNAYIAGLSPDGMLLYDSDMVKPSFEGRKVGVAAMRIAKDRFKSVMFANMVMLGAFCAVSGFVSLDAVKEELQERGVKRLEENLAALDAGVAAVAH